MVIQPFPGEPIVFVNEFHYDNQSTDLEEGLELAEKKKKQLFGGFFHPPHPRFSPVGKSWLTMGMAGQFNGNTNYLSGYFFTDQDNGLDTFLCVSGLTKWLSQIGICIS